MRSLASALVVLLLTAVAHAQPGNTPPSQPYPRPQQPDPDPPPDAPSPYYPPPPYAPPYAPPVQALTPQEHELLVEGEIAIGPHLAGGFVSMFVGLGVGQAVQGRWTHTGWIFTLGEIASVTAMVVALSDSCGQDGCNAQDDEAALFWAGLTGLVVFRVWEIVDAWSGPPRHNRRVRELRMRVGAAPPMYSRIAPYVDKPRHGSGSGGVVGLSLRF